MSNETKKSNDESEEQRMEGSSNNPPKEIRMSDDILHELVAFIARPELGNFSLVNARFHASAAPKMYNENAHWVDGECHLTAHNREGTFESTMIVPRGNGGFESVPLPSVEPVPNVLGFRGKIYFNGLLNTSTIRFFQVALPSNTTLYRFSWLDDFYSTNGLSSSFQTSENLKRFLDTCVQHVELGGDDAYLTAFLSFPSVRGIRKLRATRFRDLFIGWLHQNSGGEWRQLHIVKKLLVGERNKLIKTIFQNLKDAGPVVGSDALRFFIKMSVQNWGDPVERLPLRWLRNSRNGQCVVLVERRPADNVNVELCLIRCPFVEAQQRGFMSDATTMDDLATEFAWEEPVCTVDVVSEPRNSESDDDGNNAGVTTTPLSHFF